MEHDVSEDASALVFRLRKSHASLQTQTT